MRRFNPNLTFLTKCLNSGTRGAVLEGSSRSGKTWSGIDFLVLLDHITPGCEIIIVRETYNSFKTTLYSDFNRRLPQWLIPSPFEGVKDQSTFWLPNKSKVSLMGADTPTKFHGATSDYFFINEAIAVPQSIFDQLEQRCRRFWWMDYNPSMSDHWIYNRVCTRPDVGTLRTTFQDNPYISNAERSKILSYDPTNPANVEAGTADDYMWAVYGQGKRSAPEGLVFPLVTWVSEFPDDCERILYGLDFGYTNDPTALIKVGIRGMNMYLQKLLYYPFDNAAILGQYLMKALPTGCHVWADQSGAAMISDLRRLGLRVLPAKKWAGSIQYGIDILKRFKLHLVQDQDLRREQENYKWREVNGIRLNEPIDKYNHLWDAVRYCVQHEVRFAGLKPVEALG